MDLFQLLRLPALKNIHDKCRWTFTACVQDKKCPERMKKIPVRISEWLKQDNLFIWHGARVDDGSFLTLDEMCDDPFLPLHLGNACLYLNQLVGDDIVVLDVEPDCPEGLKADFLALPWLYAEKSMSGKGLHLLFQSPKTHEDIRFGKTALKPHGRNDYEILLNHYVTFSMQPVEHDPSRPIRDISEFLDLWETMASDAKLYAKNDVKLGDLPSLEIIPCGHRILDALKDFKFKKTPQHYSDDVSRYEFCHCLSIYNALDQLISRPVFSSHTYTDEERLILVYHAAMENIPYRPKHNENRSGFPWLLYVSKNALDAHKNRD